MLLQTDKGGFQKLKKTGHGQLSLNNLNVSQTSSPKNLDSTLV